MLALRILAEVGTLDIAEMHFGFVFNFTVF